MTTRVRINKTGAAGAPRDSLAGGLTTHHVTDDQGRVLTIKKLTALDRMRLAIAAGAETAENSSAMFYINLAASLVAIDGDPETPIQTMRTIDARVAKLDEEGLAAILRGWAEAGWLGAQAEGVDPQAAHEEKVRSL